MKARNIGILGLILTMLLAILMVPVTASAYNWSGCGFYIDENNVLQVNICASTETTVDHWLLKSSPFTVIASHYHINETIGDSTNPCFTESKLLTDPPQSSDLYLKVYTNRGTKYFYQCSEPVSPTPEMSSIGLMATGLLALGAFIYIRRRSAVKLIETG